MNKETFLKKYGITDDQFTGKEKINCDLDLRSLSADRIFTYLFVTYTNILTS